MSTSLLTAIPKAMLTVALIGCGGMGKRLRGIRYKSYRPTLVIGDDCESSQNTNTLELKQKNIDFWNKVIQPIGTPDTKFVYMGTLVANNSLLTHIMDRADYRSKLYSAIVEYPNRSDLWDEFEEEWIYFNKGEEYIITVPDHTYDIRKYPNCK